MNMHEDLIDILEEQQSVQFTGRVNILDSDTKGILGLLLIEEGRVIYSRYKNTTGMKSFFNLFIDEAENIENIYVVEPEIINNSEINIVHPLGTLKKKTAEAISKYLLSKKNKPPGNIKIIAQGEYINSENKISPNEFKLLVTLCDFNRVEDIYKNCELMDYEITDALVSLRKKNALKIIGMKQG